MAPGLVRLAIDEQYLKSIVSPDSVDDMSIDTVCEKVQEDLNKLSSDSTVTLTRPATPEYQSIFSDVMSRVAYDFVQKGFKRGKTIFGGYTVQVAQDYDARKFAAILGYNVTGNSEREYRYIKNTRAA